MGANNAQYDKVVAFTDLSHENNPSSTDDAIRWMDHEEYHDLSLNPSNFLFCSSKNRIFA